MNPQQLLSDMAEFMETFHPFRSEAAKQTYLAFYEEKARRWPVASETRMVNTSFGDTFVWIQGPVDGPKLVLMPGDSENSLSWMPLIEALSAEHRTYVLDHIYDNGRSVYTKAPQGPSDLVQWLDELFATLELERLSLVGYSYGGWQAALYALSHPHRLEKLVLIAPSATVLPPPIGLLIRAFAYYFIPLRFVTKKYLYWWGPDAVRNVQTRSRIDEMIEELMLARKCFKRRKFVPPTVLTDRDWQALSAPTLFLVGENELNYSATKAVDRLAAVAPTVTTSIAANADHYVAMVKPKWVTDQVLKFLNGSESPLLLG
ncbi:MAG: alpha/beta hydrolase [Hyphomicrobiaceae bacterium]